MKKNILLTFDYELFLGKRSGTVDNCLIRPTQRVLEILSQNQAKAIFFIDTAYLYRLEEISKSNSIAENDLKKITQQLVDIARNGHYLFHHIHPHWIDARFDETMNQWNLSNTEHFALNLLDESERDFLFRYSDNFLTGIINKAESANKCNGFRAGGIFIEPFSCFKPWFEKYGITFEFSAVPGNKMDGEKCNYDFTQCPSDRFYKFNDKVSCEDANGKFVEFPISKIRISGITKIVNSIYFRMNKKMSRHLPFGDGLFVSHVDGLTPSKKTVKNYFIFETDMSIEFLNPAVLPVFKDAIKQRRFLHFISHPKLISEVGLYSMNRLLKFCNKNFVCEYDFMKFIP